MKGGQIRPCITRFSSLTYTLRGPTVRQSSLSLAQIPAYPRRQSRWQIRRGRRRGPRFSVGDRVFGNGLGMNPKRNSTAEGAFEEKAGGELTTV